MGHKVEVLPDYIRPEDRDKYREFSMLLWKRWGSKLSPVPDELWHYTNADGLINILKTGSLFATQVSCLNDSLEQKYFGDLVFAEAEKQRAENTDAKLEPLFEGAANAARNRDFSAAGNFVTCFSEAKDDLGQWRGYGGGECGYAIGFDSRALILAANKAGSLLVPMEYDPQIQAKLVLDVVSGAKEFFLEGIARGLSDTKLWATQFLNEFAIQSDLFASIIKHPKFSGEKEHRLVHWYLDADNAKMEFRQKRTLLARHLLLDLKIDLGGVQKLPISRVYVGPGPGKQVSKVSVGDLLVKQGYKGIPVELSDVPYRMP